VRFLLTPMATISSTIAATKAHQALSTRRHTIFSSSIPPTEAMNRQANRVDGKVTMPNNCSHKCVCECKRILHEERVNYVYEDCPDIPSIPRTTTSSCRRQRHRGRRLCSSRRRSRPLWGTSTQAARSRSRPGSGRSEAHLQLAIENAYSSGCTPSTSHNRVDTSQIETGMCFSQCDQYL
jgi:hypothetical protein